MRFELRTSTPYGFWDIREWVALQGLVLWSLGCKYPSHPTIHHSNILGVRWRSWHCIRHIYLMWPHCVDTSNSSNDLDYWINSWLYHSITIYCTLWKLYFPFQRSEFICKICNRSTWRFSLFANDHTCSFNYVNYTIYDIEYHMHNIVMSYIYAYVTQWSTNWLRVYTNDTWH